MDDRNRVPVPAKLMPELRRICGVQDPEGEVDVVVSVTKNGFLGVYPRPMFEAMLDRLASVPDWEVEADDLRSTYESYMDEQTLDKQNRFRVPPLHKEFFDLERDVVVVGAGEYMEVKTAEMWKQELRDRLPNIRAKEEKVRRAGRPGATPVGSTDV